MGIIDNYNTEICEGLENSTAANNPFRDHHENDISDQAAKHRVKLQLMNEAQEIRAPVLGRGGVPVAFPIDVSPYTDASFVGPIISDHPSLRRYWDDMANALSEFPNSRFESFSISSVELCDEILELFSDKLRGRVEQKIILVRNNICSSRGIDQITTFVESNSTLSYLTICDNPITSSPSSSLSAVRLFGAVRTNPNLLSLSLSGCNIGDSCAVLSAILNSGATQILLNQNGIGTTGAGVIAAFIESNPSIEHLELDKNRFKDDDTVQLSQSLKKNTNLRSLWLRGNSFSVVGVKTMFKAVFDSSSMTAIYDSNHSCQMMLFSQMEGIQEHVGRLNTEYLEAGRRNKVKLALKNALVLASLYLVNASK